VPRSCSVCTHPKREEIDRALVDGVSSGMLAGRYRTFGERAVRRHRANHIPTTLAKAVEAAEVAEAGSLLEQVEDLQQRALAILEKAEDAGELRTALSAIREARGNLELLARLLGELNDNPVINLTISPEWVELRTLIVGALQPHPDALSDVVAALEEADHASS